MRTRRTEIRRQRPEIRGRRSEVSVQELEALIEEACSRAVDIHGPLEITLQDFTAHLNSIADEEIKPNADEAERRNALAGIATSPHITDIYLAAACALKTESAWELLYRLYNAHVDKIAHGMCHTHQQARDVASDVFAHLFKPDSSGRCRIACYTGQSSLSMWIASIVKRRAINHCQTSGEVRAARAVPLDSLRLTPNPESNLVFETALLRCKYAKAIEGSFETAAAELDERERLVLAMRCDDDVTGKDIAEMLGLHPAQISRGADNFLGCH